MIAFVLGLSWALRTYVFTAYEIPSGSMEETIMTGDMVFAEKVSYYFRDPQPGDIVTFSDPEIPGRTLIKRCIATAGQTINIDGDGFLYIDGVANGTTGIDEVAFGDEEPTGKAAKGIYNMNGQLVSNGSDTTNLPAGMYIVNGKKCVVR